MAARKKKRRSTGVLTPTLKERQRSGALRVTPRQAATNPRERGRVEEIVNANASMETHYRGTLVT